MLEIWHLNNIHLLKNIDPKELEQILEVTRTLGFKPGETIFWPENQPERLYLLHHGRVKSYTLTPNGDEWILQVFQPGDAFGGLLMGSASGIPIWTEALDEVIVSMMNEDSFKIFMQVTPNTCFRLFRYMSDQHAKTVHRLRQLLHLKAGQRLVVTLLNLSRHKRSNHHDEIDIDNAYTHVDLANMIGVHRSTVSELVSELRADGILGGQGRKLSIYLSKAIDYLKDEVNLPDVLV